MKIPLPIAAFLAAFTLVTTSGCSDPQLASMQANQVLHDGSGRSGEPTRANVVFLSPDADDERTQSVKRAFFAALEASEPGVRWHVFTSADHQHVTSFTIPEATGQRRFRELRKVLPRLHAVFDQVNQEANGQVNLPAVAASVAEQLTTEKECQVSIYGTPRYLNEDQDAFQHNVVFVTKDGSVGHALSPFQVDQNLPEKCPVVWVTPQTNYGYDERHMAAIRHFNGYYIQELGGSLLRTTEDVSLLFDFNAPTPVARIAMKHDAPGKFKATIRPEWSDDDEIEVVEFSSDDVEAPGEGMNDSPETVFAAAEQNKGTMAFGINWYSTDSACDVDMHMASNGLANELSFANQKTSWGRHFKDVVGSAASDVEADVEDFQNWEWLRVDHARLHDLVLYLNVYRTTAPARVTIVRVWNGERKTRVIDLNVKQGDGGANRANRRASNAWCRVSLYSINDSDEPGTR